MKKEAIKAKAKSVKDKVKAKAAAVKARVKGKLKGAFAAIAVLLLAAGCSTATPASRYTATTIGDVIVKNSVDDLRIRPGQATNTVGAAGEKAPLVSITTTIKLSDMTVASADSSGSTETQTATPTLDVKPDVNLNYAQGGGITNRGTGGAAGAAGIIESLTAEGLATLKDWIKNKKSGKVTLPKKDGTTTTADCKDGTCTFEDGTTVTCEDCEVDQ